VEQFDRMKVAVLVAAVSLLSASAHASPQSAAPQKPAPATSSAKVAEAYDQFLLARHYEDDNVDQAIAAYKRAMELDPLAADIPAELAALYLRENRVPEALAAAEQAVKIAPTNREGNRVLGIVYAALVESGQNENARGRGTPQQGAQNRTEADNVDKAIHHLEIAIANPDGEADPNVRATLSRLYMQAGQFDKAIPLLTTLVNQEPQWQDGPLLLAEAFAGAGKNSDAIAWLNQKSQDDPRLLPTLADFYEREHRWPDAAKAYEKAVQRAPRNTELKQRYASALMNAGGRESTVKARAVLDEIVAAQPHDGRALYLLSQAQRRLGDLSTAEKTARRVIAEDAKSPWGYYALAESLEERHEYQAVVDEVAPVVAEFRTRAGATTFERGLLLPHLGFAYQELGQYDKAISVFEEARQAAPDDPSVVGYLIEANIAAKKFAVAADLARDAAKEHPDDLRLARLEAQALRQSGKADQGVSILENAARQHPDDPTAYVALAQYYSDADRAPQAIKLLQDARTKFPEDISIAFELGAVLDKDKKFADAEAAFRDLLKRDPDNAAALNYLGYMLAERGERLDESVDLLKKALEMEPDNGSYLDSLGWAYYKADKLDLAENNLKRAADQQKTNSVIQDHYADVLFKLRRYEDAIAAWTRALNGDGDSINRVDIDKKIKTAKQKLDKK
jgi:tetratricopeptide (TPR) repeat protein